MNVKKHLPKLFIFALAAVVVSACQKKKFENLSAAEDMALAENLFSDAYKQVAGAGQATSDSLKAYNELLAGCGTLSITPFDTVNWPKTVTLDFGSSNCIGNDGRNRRGKIICSYSHWLTSPGTVVTVNFDDYFVNDHEILGTKTITNNGYNSENHLTFTISFPNCQIVKPNNGGTIHWSTTRVNEWSQGQGTFTPYDDVWDVTGSASGTSSDGIDFTLNIVQELNVQYGCRWIRSGILDMDIEGLNTITVNYGSGTCDASATATYNNVDYPFVMQ